MNQTRSFETSIQLSIYYGRGLEDNFGHRQKYLAKVLVNLNLLAFLFYNKSLP